MDPVIAANRDLGKVCSGLLRKATADENCGSPPGRLYAYGCVSTGPGVAVTIIGKGRSVGRAVGAGTVAVTVGIGVGLLVGNNVGVSIGSGVGVGKFGSRLMVTDRISLAAICAPRLFSRITCH